MPVRPDTAFDVCHSLYQALRASRGVPRARHSEVFSSRKKHGKPRAVARIDEYMADFALCGKRALASPSHASRLMLFEMYYLGGADWQAARHHAGIREDTFLDWCDEIRHLVGRRLLHVGMYPPREYFVC